MNGYACQFNVIWNTINLQDEVENARAQKLLCRHAQRQRILKTIEDHPIMEIHEQRICRLYRFMRKKHPIWRKSNGVSKKETFAGEVYTFRCPSL